MTLPGVHCPDAADDHEIAGRTLAVARETVPAAVPGLVLLSGGRSEVQATSRLDALNRVGGQPWELGFSFARALQGPVLRAWAGDDRNADSAQAGLLHRARLDATARRGSYVASMEQDRAGPGRA